MSIYRRNLPHWRLTGSVYFVTWRISKTQSQLTPDERAVIISALRYFEASRYELFAYVVMDDHVHVLLRPSGQRRLQDIVRSWKSYTANQMQRRHGRKGAVWQDEYFDRVIRDEKELLEKTQYILNNPLKRWPQLAVPYPWAWAVGYEDPVGTGTEACATEACATEACATEACATEAP